MGITPVVKKMILEGKAFYSISDTAKMLGTNSTKVRELIGKGKLDARQTRVNSKRFVVSGESINRFKYGTGTVRERGNRDYPLVVQI